MSSSSDSPGAAVAAPGAGGPGQRQDLVYAGRGPRIFLIALANVLLSLLTLGVYRFWARTRMRRYLWSSVGLNDEPFEYTGTGMELFLGFLIVAVVFVPASLGVGVVIEVLLAGQPMLQAMAQVAVALGIVFLAHCAVYRARAYRLSRTQWRGVRSAQGGSTIGYALRAMVLGAAALLSLGVLTPLKRVKLAGYRLQNSWAGDRRLDFEGRWTAMLGRWVVALLLLVPTLGLSYVWYRAAEFRFLAAHTRFGDAGFESGLRMRDLVAAYLPYYLLLALLAALALAISGVGLSDLQMASGAEPQFSASAGLALGLFLVLGIMATPLYYAIVVACLLERIVGSLRLTGSANLDALAQSRQEVPTRGEGLAEAFDVAGAF